MISISIIAACVSINSIFLCLLIVALKKGWISPATSQAMLQEISGIVGHLVSTQVGARMAVVQKQNEALIDTKALILHQEVDAKIEAKSADLETKMSAKMAAANIANFPVSRRPR